MLDLYRLYKIPEELRGHDIAYETIPWLAWERYSTDKESMKQKEPLWAKSAGWAYLYAHHIINERFPEGEDAIATDANHSYWYAVLVLESKFPKGEEIIAKHADFSYWYTISIIKGRFPEGEAAIATSEYYSKNMKIT